MDVLRCSVALSRRHPYFPIKSEISFSTLRFNHFSIDWNWWSDLPHRSCKGHALGKNGHLVAFPIKA
uniref:Uncharacterized protein n=1 Tax=Anguilla anguilla TaxID=7936 RepID=A0A0E9PPR2_ANGAN